MPERKMAQIRAWFLGLRKQDARFRANSQEQEIVRNEMTLPDKSQTKLQNRVRGIQRRPKFAFDETSSPVFGVARREISGRTDHFSGPIVSFPGYVGDPSKLRQQPCDSATSDVASTALIAEPLETFRAPLEAIFQAAGWQVIGRSTLDDARKDVAERAPGIVVTSLKLGSFNGIHLAYLAKLANPLAVCVVYGEPDRADEAQRAGAIYVERNCIREALPDILDSMFRRAAEASKYLLNFPVSRPAAGTDSLPGEKA
jgi:hypothetical protein